MDHRGSIMLPCRRGCFIELKTANEMSCHQFRECIRAFVDRELPVNETSVFLTHSEKCDDCNDELQGMRFVTASLKNLKKVTVSPEFDFRMKTSIRREHERLKQPFYSTRRFFQDNLFRILAVPAVAASLVITMFAFTGDNAPVAPGIPSNVVSELQSQEGVELVPGAEPSHVEDVQYVLDTVTQQDLQKGLFLFENGSVIPVNRDGGDISLVNF